MKYKATTNNAGEVLTLYTQAHTEAQAMRNVASQLAARLHITVAAATQRMKKPNATKLEMINDN
jgi:MarR-like DNA-binding transcriptional regulator SgrR of sgrS sRNA